MLLQKNQRNVWYNFFESLYSFAHFKCKGYILYSKLFLQWAVGKKKFFPSAKLKKIISRNFQVSHWKKKYVSIIFEVKRQKKCFVEKTILNVNLPWNDPYTFCNIFFTFTNKPSMGHEKIYCSIRWCKKSHCINFWIESVREN